MEPTQFTRRRFLETAALATGAALLSQTGTQAQTRAKYTRYNVTSEGGQRALRSYARGVEAMLRLPADHPQNWFRNAFVHMMDCPHGNWWFYVWHRGYIGYFEETIRNLSRDPEFALPYWDWTQLPQIPDSMFTGVLTPRDMAFEPFTGNLAKFTSFMSPALQKYWNNLTPAQLAQLKVRGYSDFDLMWNDVTGYNPAEEYGISGNMAYAITCGARYLTRDNPKLDPKTAYDVSPFVVNSGLLPRDFYNSDINKSFTSSKTPSHNTMPGKATEFSILEGMPHNKVHNCIGGVGPVDPGPYGNMTNFLSPVDPIFFLHHANMDRLWDVWTRKQQRLGLPWLPVGDELKQLTEEPFLLFVNGQGRYVGNSVAGEYLNTQRFDYDYEPGFGEDLSQPPLLTANQSAPLFKGSVKANTGSVGLSRASIESHLAATSFPALLAEISLPRPEAMHSTNREFDVIVGAPENVTTVDADSPYYGGTIAFFGNMTGMKDMAMDATFTVPLPKAPKAFAMALDAVAKSSEAPLSIRLVPTYGKGEAPVLKAVSVHSR